MKRRLKFYFFVVLPVSLLFFILTGRQQTVPIGAQNATQHTYLEPFGTGIIPQFNSFFTHAFSHATAWSLISASPWVPPPPSTPSYLELYWDTEDTVTYNLFGGEFVSHASVWGYADPAQNGLPAGRGRVTFVGVGDTKTIYFNGGLPQWQYFEASSTDRGDNNAMLGGITAVKLAKLRQQDGNIILFDDLQVEVVSPPLTADLALSLTGPTAPVNVGDTIAYNFTITNNGPNATTDIILENILPLGVSFNSAQSDSGCTAVDRDVTCALGNLGAGLQRHFTLAGNVGSDACLTMIDRAVVYSNTFDSNTSNNDDAHIATAADASACADLDLTQTGAPIPIEPGDEFTYVLTLFNHGPDSTAATVTSTLPAGVVLLEAYADAGVTCSENNGAVDCSVPVIYAGETKRIFLHVISDTNIAGILEHPASAAGTVRDTDPLNNDTIFRFAVGRAYDFTLIAELGVGDLAPYTMINNLALNDNGVVAFSVNSDTTRNADPADHIGVYYGSGGTLTQVMDETDLTPLPAGQGYFFDYDGGSDINNNNMVVFLQEVHGETDSGSGYNLLATTILTGNGGALSTIATDSKAASGVNFRQYAQPVINNQGRVVASYHNSGNQFFISGFENNVETIFVSSNSQFLNGLGQSNTNYIAYFDQPGTLMNELKRFEIGQGSITVAQIPNQFDNFCIHQQ